MIGKFHLPISTGGSEPDYPVALAIACPAAGYILINHDFVPPEGIVIPESTPQSIVFICNSSFGNWTSPTFTKGGTSSNYRYQFYDLSGNLLYSQDSSSANVSYTFPSVGYFIVKVSLVTSGGYFLSMVSTYSDYSFIIEKITFNTPNVTSLANCCKYMSGLRAVEFNCTLDVLTTFANAFQYAGLYNFVFKDSYPALTSVAYMFSTTEALERVEFPVNCNLPALTSLSYFINLSNVYTLLLPSATPVLTNMSNMCQDSKNLSTIRHISDAPLLVSSSYAFSGVNLRGEQTLKIYSPTVYNAAADGTYMYHNLLNITKITLVGPSNPTTINFQNLFYLCRLVQDITFPSSFGTSGSPNLGSAANVIKKVKTPDLLLPNSSGDVVFYAPDGTLLEEVTGDMDNTGLSKSTPAYYQSKNSLRIFNCPKLRCSAIRFGYSNTDVMSKLEVLEVDWVNSSWDTTIGALAYNLQITANVSAAWLNSLMTKLPTVTGTKTLYIKYCTGFATCDKSIATNKGWTVI